jgi:hypothetical protein
MGNAPVSQLNIALGRDEHIVGLDVTMHDVL